MVEGFEPGNERDVVAAILQKVIEAETQHDNLRERSRRFLDWFGDRLDADYWTLSHMVPNADGTDAECRSHLEGGRALRGGSMFQTGFDPGSTSSSITAPVSPSVHHPAAGLLSPKNGNSIKVSYRAEPQIAIEFCLYRHPNGAAFVPRDMQLMQSVLGGVTWLHRADEPAANEKIALTPRQRQILKLLLRGDSPKQIARELELADETIRTYIKHLYRRLGVGTRGELLSKFVTGQS